MNAKSNPPGIRQLVTKELALLTGFLFIGLAIMPLLIYYVGQVVFGEYSGVGYADFYGTLSGKIRNGNGVAWFLMLSPYLGWQFLRITILAWRLAGRQSLKSQ